MNLLLVLFITDLFQTRQNLWVLGHLPIKKQMAMTLAIYRPRQLQWTWFGMNRPNVCWVMVSTSFSWTNGRTNRWRQFHIPPFFLQKGRRIISRSSKIPVYKHVWYQQNQLWIHPWSCKSWNVSILSILLYQFDHHNLVKQISLLSPSIYDCCPIYYITNWCIIHWSMESYQFFLPSEPVK